MNKDIKRITVKKEGEFSYDICLEDSFGKLGEELERLNCRDRKICIVTDSNVAPLYLEEVRKIAEDSCSKTEVFQFPAGEENKTLDVVRSLYKVLIEAGFDRHDFLLALGGGVTGRSHRIRGGYLSQGHILHSGADHPSGSDRQQHRWKDGGGF